MKCKQNKSAKNVQNDSNKPSIMQKLRKFGCGMDITVTNWQGVTKKGFVRLMPQKKFVARRSATSSPQIWGLGGSWAYRPFCNFCIIMFVATNQILLNQISGEEVSDLLSKAITNPYYHLPPPPVHSVYVD